MSRVLVYIMFIALVGTGGFALFMPAAWKPESHNSKRLDAFLMALQGSPRSILSAHFVNGQSALTYSTVEKPGAVLTTVVPIEWKGQLFQQLLDKHIPFTVCDPDYTWAILIALTTATAGYFRFSILPSWSHRACPQCAETINTAALICRYCGTEFRPLGSTVELQTLDADSELLLSDAEAHSDLGSHLDSAAQPRDLEPCTVGQPV